MRSKVAYFGVFTALALIFSYVETLIPFNFGIPGVKLGLANLIIVIALYKMNLREAYLLSVVRVVLAGFIFGNYFSIIYSLAGGILSLTVMAFMKKKGGFRNLSRRPAGIQPQPQRSGRVFAEYRHCGDGIRLYQNRAFDQKFRGKQEDPALRAGGAVREGAWRYGNDHLGVSRMAV